MMKKKNIAALILCTAFATSAFAADQGFYVGANVGQSSTDTFTLSTKTGTAFSVLAGYQFIKYVAAEIQYNDFGSPTATGGSFKINGYSAAAVGILPFNDQWSLMAKLGYASTKMGSPVDVTKSDVTYGIGGQFNIDRNWGVRANYDQYKVGGGANTSNQTATTSVFTIGVAYKF